MSDPTLREIVARSICQVEYLALLDVDNERYEKAVAEDTENYLRHADAALAAIEGAGYVIVPRARTSTNFAADPISPSK